MNKISMNAPIFQHTQRVKSMGGEGIVQGFRPRSGSWPYATEMVLGPKPIFGRVGAETIIILNEEELCVA